MPSNGHVRVPKSSVEDLRGNDLRDPRDIPFPESDLPAIILPDSYPDPPTRPRVNILQRLKHKSTVYGILTGLATAIAAVTGVSIGEPILDIAAFIISGIISVVLIFWKPADA